jgi:hypothetical protein
VVLGAVGGQDAPQPVAPAAAGNPAERPVHGPQVEDAADLRLVDGSRKPGFRKHFSKVHQRSRHARDRNGFHDVAVLSAQATRGVHHQPRMRLAAAWCSDLDLA